uniref:ATP-binding protein n=1 Tax=Paraburkholderia nemoris TaxID=2793076 RepID=UPI0038BB2BCC
MNAIRTFQMGTLRSFLTEALGQCAARQGRDVLFVTQTDLIKKLHAARSTGLYERKFQQFVRVPLPIIDDFALKPLRAPHDEDFHDLAAGRYERAATILTPISISTNGAMPSPTTGFSAPRRSTRYAMVPTASSSRARASASLNRCLKTTKTPLQNPVKNRILEAVRIRV